MEHSILLSVALPQRVQQVSSGWQVFKFKQETAEESDGLLKHMTEHLYCKLEISSILP